MQRAYDTILSLEVTAKVAAQNSNFERYRYRCLCCGEEVYIAAPNSTKQIPHFRHKRGNNDTECEQYLTQRNSIFDDLFGLSFSISTCEKRYNKVVDFYYDSIKKIFEISIIFTESEIDEYELHNAELQLSEKKRGKPFDSIKINRKNFVGDEEFRFLIKKYAHDYYVSISTEDTEWECEGLFSKNGILSFFKIQGKSNEFRAKLIRGKKLFTNTLYFVVFQNHYDANSLKRFKRNVEIVQEDIIETMNNKFCCMILKISEKSDDLVETLDSYGYQLEYGEEVKLIWPPVALCNDVYMIPRDNMILNTSFELRACENINLKNNDIIKLGNNISKINIHKRTKIYHKNTEMVFEPNNLGRYELNKLEKEIIWASKFDVPDENNEYCLLYDKEGTTLLQVGQTVYLTPSSKVIRYRQSYAVQCILYQGDNCPNTEQLLYDILKHYKREEIYNENEFETCKLSEIAARYIQKCRMKGTINSVVKDYIKEGMI